MGHGHDDHKKPTHPSGVDLPEVKPHDWSDSPRSKRAREQWDPLKLAHKYLDEMEQGGRLHLKKKKG